MSSAEFLWQFVVVFGAVSALVAAVASLRRRPPISEEMLKFYATKQELHDALQAIECRCTEERASRRVVYDKIEAVRNEVAQSFRIVEKSIGRLEGQISRSRHEGEAT